MPEIKTRQNQGKPVLSTAQQQMQRSFVKARQEQAAQKQNEQSESGDRNPILHLCGFLVTTQLSALGTDKTILIPVVFHVLDPSDLVTKLLGFLCFVIG